MPDSRRFRLVATLVPFFLIVATAAGARVGYLLTYADNATRDGPLTVQDSSPDLDLSPGTELRGRTSRSETDLLIHNMKEHHTFESLAPFADREEPTAHTSPGYAWLVGELERMPIDLGGTDALVRWIQCGLGTMTAGLYFLFAWRAFGSRVVAVVAGLLCALHPFWIVNTAMIADGVLVTFLLAASLWLGARSGQAGGALTTLFYGLALAGLALVRAALLPFAVAAMLWFLLRARKRSGGWEIALLAFLGFLIGLTPWMLRNFQKFGDFYPIVDSTYLHLWMGNNPQATGGPVSEETMLRALADARGQRVQETREQLAGLSQPARYRALAQAVVDEVQSDPAATLQRRLWAGLYFWFGEDWFGPRHQLWRTNENGSTETLPGWFPALMYGSLLGMLLLGFLGWRWSHARAAEAMPSSLAVIWIPLPYLLGHAEALSGPRLPLDGVLLCYAALALVCLVPGFAMRLLRPRRSEE